MSTVKPIPEGFNTVTPYLIVNDGAAAIDFYKKAFGATELARYPMPDGKVAHAEIKIGNSPIMMGCECPEMKASSPHTYGGTPVSILLYVQDCDALYKQAVNAGAKVVKEIADQFYGDRSGTVTDPFGHVWTISTHKEDVSEEEMEKRMKSCMEKHAK